MSNKKEPPFFNEDNLGSFHYKLPFYETMELFIETLTGTCFELRVSPFETVVCVKAKIQRLEGIPIAQQHLIWNNKELEDECSLNDYNISEGCTLKLVLAMRGGPINTRRVPLDDPVRDLAEYMDPVRDEMWEKAATNKQVTFLVYREGDQLNFFRVVDRGDGTLTPLSESLSGGSVYNFYAEDEDGYEASPSGQQIIENSITMNKMKLLKSKMESMNLNKKPKKSSKLKPRPPNAPRPTSGSMAFARHRLLRVLPHIGQTFLPPGNPYVSESSHNALSTLTAATRTIPSITSDFLKEEEETWESSALIPSLTNINLPPKVSRVELENASQSTNTVLSPVTPLPKKDGLTKDSDSLLHQNLNLFSSEETSRSISESFALLAEASPSEQYGELCSLRKMKSDFELTEVNDETSAVETHQTALSKSLNAELMETSLINTAEISPPRGKFLSPIHFSPQLNNATFSKTCQPKCFDLGSLRPPASHSHFHSLQLQNMADPAFSRTTRFRGVKVESPGKRSDVITKMEARDMTELVNKASKEPMGSLNNLGFFASLARSASRDNLNSSSNPGRLRNLVAPPTTLQEEKISLHDSLNVFSAPHGLGQSVINASCGKSTVEATHLFPPVKSAIRSKKKASKHCFLCGKKTGLATSYECRCGNNFCATHRYAETHSCTYDYKTAGRRYLQESNPVITAPKLPKI
ncbi:AN1-type zinc finger protein 4 [Bufo bufo]|uniref:AN1-type zinc finger protein 4 n=1 Tax=Bufo bufo TaxID=8384 RepID=UPI001ABDCE2E|nr:AN1-type zinc finger protein 4 [Bufo bufo]XP_040290993.1 AN1-type zinc finger protein 4 [Bufo bufo]XP_040290994.1 AN1-type zinc finger protein 4 [Bufo bufo]